MSVYDFRVKDKSQQDVSLADFKGQVLLIVKPKDLAAHIEALL